MSSQERDRNVSTLSDSTPFLTSFPLCRYVREIVPVDMRAGIDHLSQLFVALGVFGALLVNWALPHTEWRIMLGIGSVHAALLGVGKYEV